jgi:hypothetical protein
VLVIYGIKTGNVGILIHIVLRKVAENNHSSCAQKDDHQFLLLSCFNIIEQ